MYPESSLCASLVSFYDPHATTARQNPVTHVYETPHDEEYDRFRNRNADNVSGNVRIWLVRVQETVD